MLLGTPLIIVLAGAVLATSFIAGVFGMAGGMILMGVLIFVMPVPAAMVLHAVTQLASNGWRCALWRRYIEFAIVARFSLGAAVAFAVFSAIRYVPDRITVLAVLGMVAILAVAVPERLALRIDRSGAAEACGFVGIALQLISGVSGPLLDAFFVRLAADRRTIVASKAACQVIGHAAKLVYFGGIIDTAQHDIGAALLIMVVVLAITGTTLARTLLYRITDHQFRRWQIGLVLAVGVVYLGQAVALSLARL